MINLIPPQAKKSLLREYWLRAVSVWLLLWSFFIVIGTFLLLPVYVLIGSQVAVYEDSATAASERVTNYENVSTALVQPSRQARFILDETTKPFFSDYITLFKNLEGKGIDINKIHLAREQNDVEPVSLSGVATDRQTLAAFRDRILALEVVSEVDLPLSNLARDKDIPFTISVTLHNEKDL